MNKKTLFIVILFFISKSVFAQDNQMMLKVYMQNGDTDKIAELIKNNKLDPTKLKLLYEDKTKKIIDRWSGETNNYWVELHISKKSVSPLIYVIRNIQDDNVALKVIRELVKLGADIDASFEEYSIKYKFILEFKYGPSSGRRFSKNNNDREFRKHRDKNNQEININPFEEAKKSNRLVILEYFQILKSEKNSKFITSKTKFSAFHKDNSIENKLKLNRESKITALLKTIKLKGEYEKQNNYEDRFNKVKKIYEELYSITFFEREHIKSHFNYSSYNYDSENEVLQLVFTNTNPFLIKLPIGKSKSFIKNIKNIQFSSIDIEIVNEDIVEIRSGQLRDEFGNIYSVNNELNFNNPNSIKEDALKILKEAKSTVIRPKIDFYSNGKESQLFTSKSSSYLIDYVKEYEEKISNSKNSILRNKKEFESLDDYKRAISLDNVKTTFSPLLLHKVFKKHNPNFDIMQYDSQEYSAEDEVFKISYKDFGVLYIKVSIANAESFGTALKRKQIKPQTWPHFVFLYEYTIVISSITFKNFNENYNASESISYKGSNITLLSQSIKTPVVNEEMFNTLKERRIEIKKIEEEYQRVVIESRKIEDEQIRIENKGVEISEAEKRIKNKKEKLALEKKYIDYIGKYEGKLKGISFKYFISIKDDKLYREDDKGSKPSYLVRPSSMGKIKENVYYFDSNLTKTHSIKFDLRKNRLIEKIDRTTIKMIKTSNEQVRIVDDSKKIVEEESTIENKKKKIEEDLKTNITKKNSIEEELIKIKKIADNEGIVLEKKSNNTEEDLETPFAVIESVPTYPGCTGTNEQKKKCFSQKIYKFISKKFNADLPNELGLSSGKKRINVKFYIDKNGDVKDVTASAPHSKLEKEAIRIIKLLPKIEPGLQRGKPVRVPYAIPITINVQD